MATLTAADPRRSAILIAVFLAGCAAAHQTTPSPELISATYRSDELESPTARLPAAGVCPESDEPFITVVLGIDTPNPRCVKVRGGQLRVINERPEAVTVTFAGRKYVFEPGADRAFAPSLDEIWAPGVHLVRTSAYNFAVWLLPD